MFEHFRRDLEAAWRHQEDDSAFKRGLRVATSQGVIALGVYRLGRWLHARPERPLAALRPAHFFLGKLSEVVTGIKIFPTSDVGPGCYIHNFGGVVINGDLGEDCVVVQGGQLLSRADGRKSGLPRVGKRVYIGAGAKILGNVSIGDDARIGANAVVLQSVPAGATAVGVPARVLVRPGVPAAHPTMPASVIMPPAAMASEGQRSMAQVTISEAQA